jgi:peptide-methionine (S)-S-oxide reductase
MKTIFVSSAIIIFSLAFLTACREIKPETQKDGKNKMEQNTALEKATFGEGCFWCSQAIFEKVKGVKSVYAGYSGGTTDDPSYEEVCTGNTGYAESVQITFDPKVISYDELLKIFWKTHDPTTLNRQGPDVGTQYRSVIFYHNNEQKEKAEHYKQELDKSGIYKDPIVTEIVPFTKFYKAEEYHQDYFAKNPTQGYCSLVIAPKVEKFEKIFKDKLK